MPSSADGPHAPRLRVLDDVTWDGAPVPGERTRTLLSALAEAGSRGLSEQALVEEVWGDDIPANPTKALQVVVSRARAVTGPAVVERTARGYRLVLGETEVSYLNSLDAGQRRQHRGRARDEPLVEMRGDVGEAQLDAQPSVAEVGHLLDPVDGFSGQQTGQSLHAGHIGRPGVRDESGESPTSRRGTSSAR